MTKPLSHNSTDGHTSGFMSPTVPGTVPASYTISTRYSREDFADQVRRLTLFAEEADEAGSEIVDVNVSLLRITAAMMSEAANRTPTHRELVRMIDATPKEEKP